MVTSPSTVETARLALRRHVASDLDACAALWGDPDVTRFITGTPLTREDAWARILRYIGHWEALGFGFWAVRERATGEVIGEVGLADFKRDIEPSLDGYAEAAWVFATRAHGKGLATEAVRGALSWLDANRPGVAAACIIRPDNVASLRVAAKCGFLEQARTLFKSNPVVVFVRPAG